MIDQKEQIVRLPCGCAIKGHLFFRCHSHALGKLLKELLYERKKDICLPILSKMPSDN